MSHKSKRQRKGNMKDLTAAKPLIVQKLPGDNRERKNII